MKDRRLYHTVSKKIMKMIDTGVYPPGSRLPGERELAEKFNVSRVTIREAEIALQALGHIRIKTGSGVYVLESPHQGNGSKLDITAFELTEARLLFEAESAALAARNISDENLSILDECIERMGEPDASEEEAELADRDFHLTIAAASNNAVVRHTIESLWKMRTEVEVVKKVYKSVCSEDTTTRTGEHLDILEALRSRDPLAARVAMQKHFRRLLKSMLDVTEEQALEEVRKKTSQSRERYLDSVRN